MFPSFGQIRNPFNVLAPGTPLATSTQGRGLIVLVSNLVRLMIVMAGVYALWNFILAGYQFLNAGGEPKNVAKAWERIWQSVLGLAIVASSLLIAMIVGWIVFGNFSALISPVLYTP